MSDDYKDLVGFTFSSQQLVETFRVHINNGFMRTPPMILPNGHSLIGVQGSTQGDSGRKYQRAAAGSCSQGRTAPSRAGRSGHRHAGRADAHGRRQGRGGRWRRRSRRPEDGTPFNGMNGGGQSIASAAASQTHLSCRARTASSRTTRIRWQR